MGARSGKQFDRNAIRKNYKYTKEDCDIILGINSNNGDCYIIPVEKIQAWGITKSLSNLEAYKENWRYFLKSAS